MASKHIKTPVGWLKLTSTSKGLCGLDWVETPKKPCDDPCPIVQQAAKELAQYFAGNLQEFKTPLDIQATPHVKKVVAEMRKIPYGQTRTYGQIAKAIGSSPRAVGQAVHRHSIALFIPCHRVMGAGGNITGYSGGQGIATKKILLALEGVSPYAAAA